MNDETFIRLACSFFGFISGSLLTASLIGWAARQVLEHGRWENVINKTVLFVSGKSVL